MTSERDKLIEAVAIAVAHDVGYSDDEIEQIKKRPGYSSATHWFHYQRIANAALTVVLANLRVVTPAMKAAWLEGCESKQDGTADWLAMLDSSPLAEGQSAAVREDGE